MKSRNGKMKLSAAALAVQGVFAAVYAMPAQAQDQQLGSLRVPANFVEFGALGVSQDSAKFGEYTGLNKRGGYFIGNFDVRGGDAYGEGKGTTRWQLRGDDLGLTSRSLGATMSNQGRWDLGINFDQLTHYTSDSYQTPYLGDMGGNRWVLPANFGSVPTAAPGTRVLTPGQLAAFHNVDINNTRENTTLNGGLILNRQWSVKVDYNHLNQSGAKLMGFGAYGSAAVGGAGTGEKVAILPMPTNYDTDTVNVALNWLGEKSNATLSYFGSYFHDNNNGVQFQTFTGVTNIQTMGTPPSNDFHQLNLTGGYQFSKRTKLAGGLSYGATTQNTSYGYDTFAMVTPSPTSSLNGDVRSSHADLKLTDQTTRNLILSGAVKYDYRDNRTASNIYNFNAISGGNTANYPNAPLSYKKSQAELAGDYRLSAMQKVRLAYNHDDTHRFCNQYASGGGTPPYDPGTNCVTVFRTMEDRLSAGYRLRVSNGVNLNAGYSYSDRRSDRDENARAPMIGLDGNVVVAPALPGVGTPANITGINAGEFRGFNPFFEASRKQNQLKGGVNWASSERVSFGVNGRITDDNYGTTFGMQNGRSWSLNFDGTYLYSEKGSVTAYVTQQERTRDMTNEQRSPTTNTAATQTATAVLIPPGGTWNNNLKDTDTTIGLNVKHGGFMGGRLELSGDAIYQFATTRFSTTLNYNTTTTTGLTCADPSIYTCVPTPDINSQLFIFKVSGTYQVAKNSKVAAGYWYQHLKSDDFYYNGLQTAFTPTSVLPTNQTAPTYHVNVIYGSYIYEF